MCTVSVRALDVIKITLPEGRKPPYQHNAHNTMGSQFGDCRCCFNLSTGVYVGMYGLIKHTHIAPEGRTRFCEGTDG